MATGAVMLLLGFIVAIVLVVFLSNAAPSQPEAVLGGGLGTAAGTPGAAAGAGAGTEAGAGTGVTGGGGGSGTGPVTAPPTQVTGYAPASSSNKDSMRNGETLSEGSSLTSKNGKYIFVYEFGQAFVKSGTFKMWQSTGATYSGGVLKITDDGNVGIFSSAYSVTPIGWASATSGRGSAPYVLQIKDDGNLVLFDSTNQIMWKPTVTMPPVNVDCAMSDWSEWTACDKTCGGGNQTRTRSVLREANEGGQACGPLSESRACNQAPCNDCRLSDWSAWGACLLPNADGVGTKTRNKTVVDPGGPGGAACPAPAALVETSSCQNCVVGPWQPAGTDADEFANAPTDKATGVRTLTRSVATPASAGGTECSRDPSFYQKTRGGYAVGCELASIDAATWSACSGGSKSRTVNVNVPVLNGGTSCETVYRGSNANAVVSCTPSTCTETMSCAVDCVLASIPDFGTCTSGSRTRSASIQTPAQGSGTSCVAAWRAATNNATAVVTCTDSTCTETQGCADCVLGTDKVETLACPAGRTGGTRKYRMSVTTAAINGGACNNPEQSENCPKDCVLGTTQQETQACTGGTRKYKMNVVTAEADGGTCNNPEQSETCGIPWKGACVAHKTFNGSRDYTVENFDSEAKNGWTIGYNVSSKDEYCRYGREMLVGNHQAGWATLDPCCVPPRPTYTYTYRKNQDGWPPLISRDDNKTRRECEDICNADSNCKGILTYTISSTDRGRCWKATGFPSPYNDPNSAIALKNSSSPPPPPPPPSGIPWKGACVAHKTFNGSQNYTVENFDSEAKSGSTIGYGVSSKDEYCRYGRNMLVGSHQAGWATLDPCC